MQNGIISEAAQIPFSIEEKGRGYFTVDLKPIIGQHVRQNFESSMNRIFDVTYQGLPLDPTAKYENLIISAGGNLVVRNLKNISVTVDTVELIQSDFEKVARVLFELVKEFSQGLKIEEREKLKIYSLDIRRYTKDIPGDTATHRDGRSITLSFSPNGNGPVIKTDFETVRSNPWELVAISNTERIGALATKHMSPESLHGRLFVRVMLFGGNGNFVQDLIKAGLLPSSTNLVDPLSQQ